MPELPEVETLVRRLREPVIGRTIENVTVYWKRTVARPAPKEFVRMLRGYTVQAIDRRAKYLVFTLKSFDCTRRSAERNEVESKHAAVTPTLFLLIHLKMSGKLSVVNRSEPIAKHDRVVFDLDDGRQLRFNDIRKFGKMWLVADPEMVTGAIANRRMGRIPHPSRGLPDLQEKNRRRKIQDRMEKHQRLLHHQKSRTKREKLRNFLFNLVSCKQDSDCLFGVTNRPQNPFMRHRWINQVCFRS